MTPRINAGACPWRHSVSDSKIYIGELSDILNRRRGTIRGWEKGTLPAHLQGQRDEAGGWRYWTPVQIAGIKEWMLEQRMSPGSGIRGMTPEKEAAELERLRGRKAA